jgi:IS4 transposase
LKLRDLEGQAFALIRALRADPEASRQSFAVQVCEAKSGDRLTAYVHCQRLSEAHINRARRKARRKSGKARKSIKAETLFLCEWVLVVTSVPPAELSAEVILQLYRVRWQIELLIKRFKSLLDRVGL